MLGDITVQYNDLENSEQRSEQFSNVDDVAVAGNPDGIGKTIIVSFADERSNAVRSGTALQSIA